MNNDRNRAVSAGEITQYLPNPQPSKLVTSFLRQSSDRAIFAPSGRIRLSVLGITSLPTLIVRAAENVTVEARNWRIGRVPSRLVDATHVSTIYYQELAGMDKLYDLKTDPHEMRNLIDQPRAGKALDRMRLSWHDCRKRRQQRSPPEPSSEEKLI